MDQAGFQRWLDAYIDAWGTYEVDAIADLFAKEVEYRFHPWDEPVRGRAAIVESWLADRDEPDSWTAEYRPWLVSGADAVAVGFTRYLARDRTTVEREYHNVFLCRFDGDGRCREFTELFLKRD